MAVLMVVAFHAGLPVPGGFAGVDVFFVVSGFVITAMLGREWGKSDRIDLRGFYWRRFKRLTPALALMIAVTVLLSAALSSPLGPQQTAAKTAIGATLLMANFVIARSTGGYFDAPAEINPLLHTWSLSVEEQFYLFFPALLIIGWALARHRAMAWTPIFVAGLAGVSFALAVAGSGGFGTSDAPGFLPAAFLGFYSPVTRIWEFAAGALLALTLAGRTLHSNRLLSGLGLAGLGILGAAMVLINERTPFPGVWTLLPVVGALLLLLAGSSVTATMPSRILSSHPMVKIGDWSYSIYLWHWPFIVFARLIWGADRVVLLLAALVSFLPAVASYRWVEQPIRNRRRLALPQMGRLVAAVLVPPLLLGTALWSGARHGWWSQPVRELQAATMTRHVYENGICNEPTPLGAAVSDVCVWNRDADGPSIYLLGDSNAGHFSEGVIQAARATGRPVTIRGPGRCPFVDVVVIDSRKSRAENEKCRSFVPDSLDYLSRAEKGLVIIANSDSYWVSHEDWFDIGTSPDGVSREPDRKLAALRIGLGSIVERLMARGHQVLLVQAAPRWMEPWTDDVWDPNGCNVLVVIRGHCIAHQPLESFLKRTAAARSVLEEVARKSGAAIWDPNPLLCPMGVCSTTAPSFTRYQDAGHISVAQSAGLALAIREVTAAIHRPAAGN